VRLWLDADQAAVVAAHARATYPNEACGLLIGYVDGADVRVDKVVASPNVAEPPTRNRFELDPGLLLTWQRHARAAGQSVVGIYHSHPDGRAEPSAHDMAGAWIANQAWVIQALTRDQIGPWAAFWRGSAQDFQPMDLAS